MEPRHKLTLRFYCRCILFSLLSTSWAVSCSTPWELPPKLTATRTLPAATATSTLTPTIAPSVTLTITPTQPYRAGQYPYARAVRVRSSGGDSKLEKVRYLLYLPEAYFTDEYKRWPLILYLHGSGEAGTDLNLLKRNGLPQKLANENSFPFIVVSPQIPAPPPGGDASSQFDVENYLATWGWKPHIRQLEGLLEDLSSSLRVDERRIFLTGISLGGFGVWRYALEYPERFAAAIPLAGGYRFVDNELPKNLCDLKNLPIWAFHGELDGNVFPERSEVMIEGLKACGSTVARLTLYPNLTHDVWTTAYAYPELWEWLLSQKIP